MSANPRGGNAPDSSHDNNSNVEPKAYSFNGKVVIGIGIVLVIAAGSTIVAMNLSTSPQIHLSRSVLGVSSAASAQTPQINTQHVDKKFILIQKDFGWNGTFGGPPIVVTKGDIIQITIINAGRMSHNFGIAKVSDKTMNLLSQISNMSLSQRVNYIPYNMMAEDPCPDCHPMFEKGHIDFFMQPDTQQVITFTADQVGNFKYFCMVRGHLWLGMIGDLIVQDIAHPTESATTTTANTVPTGEQQQQRSAGV